MTKDLNNLIRIIPDFPKPGIVFKDITPLIADGQVFSYCCNEIAKFTKNIDYVAGIEARGFIFASAVSVLTGKGFIPIRKSGKLPGQTISQSYELEYGKATLEMHSGLIPKGKKVLVVDDVLATGGTAVGAAQLLLQAELVPTSFAFLLEIPQLGARSRITKALPGLQIHTILAE